MEELAAHPGVATDKTSTHAEKGSEASVSPKSNMDNQQKQLGSAPSASAANCVEEPDDSEGEAKAEQVVDEAINLVSDDEKESEGPMSHEEFKAKRADIRRGEWTMAKELREAAEEDSGTETEVEEEQVMYIGPTFNGPPMLGPLRAESLSDHLKGMKSNGASVEEIAERRRLITPVCYMMNESSAPKEKAEGPVEKPKSPPPEDEV